MTDSIILPITPETRPHVTDLMAEYAAAAARAAHGLDQLRRANQSPLTEVEEGFTLTDLEEDFTLYHGMAVALAWLLHDDPDHPELRVETLIQTYYMVCDELSELCGD